MSGAELTPEEIAAASAAAIERADEKELKEQLDKEMRARGQ